MHILPITWREKSCIFYEYSSHKFKKNHAYSMNILPINWREKSHTTFGVWITNIFYARHKRSDRGNKCLCTSFLFWLATAEPPVTEDAILYLRCYRYISVYIFLAFLLRVYDVIDIFLFMYLFLFLLRIYDVMTGMGKGAFCVATGIVQRHDVSILYSVIVTSSHDIIMKDKSWSNILL